MSTTNSIRRALRTATIAAALAGCADPRQAAIDDAHRRGQISADERRRLTLDLDQQRQAELQSAIRRRQEHPTGPRAAKLVYPQREEND